MDSLSSAEQETRLRTGVVQVCTTCRSPKDSIAPSPTLGADLTAALTDAAAAVPGVTVQPVACLGNCSRGATIALHAPGACTYVFGELTPETAADVVQAACLLRDAEDGLLPWGPRPESLKKGLIARLPPPAR